MRVNLDLFPNVYNLSYMQKLSHRILGLETEENYDVSQLFHPSYFFFVVLGIKSRVLYMQGKQFIIALHLRWHVLYLKMQRHDSFDKWYTHEVITYKEYSHLFVQNLMG